MSEELSLISLDVELYCGHILYNFLIVPTCMKTHGDQNSLQASQNDKLHIFCSLSLHSVIRT